MPGSEVALFARHKRIRLREIIPAIERRYAVDPAHRALFGVSRSTVGALDSCANGGVSFAACVLVAPAVDPGNLHAVLPALGARTRFIIETGTYDLPLVTDARALSRALRRRALGVSFHESPEGHNHTAWKKRLPDLLEHLFR